MASNPFSVPVPTASRTMASIPGRVVGAVAQGIGWTVMLPFRLVGRAAGFLGEAVSDVFYGVRVAMKPDLVLDPRTVSAAAKNYNTVYQAAGANTAALGTDVVKSAARDFNNATSRLGFTEGKLGASIKGLWRSVAGVFVDTSNWGSTAIKGGDIAKATQSALNAEAGIIERVLSKPVRIAANNPKTAIAAGLATGAVAVGSWLSGRAERRTQESAMAEVATAQQKYMNSVTPAEHALMEQRMRSKGHMTDNVMASKQAETAPSQAAG